MASDAPASKVATPSTPKAPAQQSSSTPASLFLVLTVGLLWAHLAAAEHFGGFRLTSRLGKSTIIMIKYLLSSFALYVVKPPVIEGCCRAAGLDLLKTTNIRWSSDNLHLLSTGLGVWAIAYSLSDPGGDGWVGVLVIEIIIGILFAGVLNISWSEDYSAKVVAQTIAPPAPSTAPTTPAADPAAK